MGITRVTVRKVHGARRPRPPLTTVAIERPASRIVDDASSDDKSDRLTSSKSSSGRSDGDDLLVDESSKALSLESRFFDHVIDPKPPRALFVNPFAFSTRHAHPEAYISPFAPGNEPWINAGDEIAHAVLASAKPGSAAAAAVALAVSRGERVPTTARGGVTTYEFRHGVRKTIEKPNRTNSHM